MNAWLARCGTKFDSDLTVRETWIGSLTLLGVAFFANIIRKYGADGMLSMNGLAGGVLRTGAFDLLAWLVIVDQARSLPATGSASRGDILLTGLIGICCALPTRLSLAAGMLLFIVCRLRSRTRGLRSITTILAALVIEIVSTSTYFSAVHVAVGRIDAKIVTAIYQIIGWHVVSDGNFVHHADGSFGIIIVAGCASSFVLAGTALAFFVTSYFRGETFSVRWLPWLLTSLSISIILTELRLSIMVSNEASFTWWHDGPGVSIYSMIAAAIPVGLSILCSRRERPS